MGKMLSMISNKELRMFEKYVDWYAIQEDGSERDCSAEYLLREWDSAKSNYLGDMFEDSLILSKEICYETSRDELEKRICEELLYPVWDGDTKARRDFIYSLQEIGTHSKDKYDREAAQRIYYGMHELLHSDSFVDNIFNGDTFELILPNGKSLKVPTGAKTVKILSKIVSAFGLDEEEMEKFRLDHSRILNQKRLKGNLCISIHPLDYVTMSDNDCDWDSCMSWQNSGCYRQGTVEMMNSPMVVVAYLTAKENMELCGCGTEWNNKKWRQLFIVTPAMITDVKSYPYHNAYLTHIVLEWLKELAEKAKIGTYEEKSVNWDPENKVCINEVYYDITTNTNYMYNDFENNDRGQQAFFSTVFGQFCWNNRYELNYSGKSECMACGSLDVHIECEEYLVCENCYSPTYCEICGDYTPQTELRELDGEWLCKYCYDERATEDSLTGEIHNYSNMTPIYLANNRGTGFYRDSYIYTAKENLDWKSITKEYFTDYSKTFYWTGYYHDSVYAVKINQLTEQGKKLFGITSEKDLIKDLTLTPFVS